MRELLATNIEKLPSTVQIADSCDSRRRCLGCLLCFFFYVLECTTILAAYTLLNYDVRQMTVRKIVHIDMDAFMRRLSSGTIRNYAANL